MLKEPDEIKLPIADIKDDVCKERNIKSGEFDKLLYDLSLSYPGSVSLYSSSTFYEEVTGKKPIVINGVNYFLMTVSEKLPRNSF